MPGPVWHRYRNVPSTHRKRPMKTGLKRTALLVLLMPLLGAATSCSSSPRADSGPESDPASPTSAATSKSPRSGPAKEPPPAPPSADASGQPIGESQAPEAVVQSPQPAPEPTFAAPEKKFLENKVPEGTDPNAVLQVGRERCDQLVSAKAVDQESVLSELIMNPGADTADAIASLCPELQPDLDAAGLGFPDGVFSVGNPDPHADSPSIAVGTYRAYGAPEGCTVTVYSASGNLIGSYDGAGPVSIGADAARVESTQCYSWFRS